MKPLRLLLVAALVATGCTAEKERMADAHGSTAHQHTSLSAGDGTRASYVGYSIQHLRLPKGAGTPGRYSFRIGTYRGTTQTDFFQEQTKRMHVYVVRDDLAVFRHLHPTMREGGTWSGNLTLPSTGRYRLVAEFVAVDEGGRGDHVILGAAATVGAPTQAVALPAAARGASAQGIEVHVAGEVRSGPSDPDSTSLTIGVTKEGEPAVLGTYLGTYAHVTGFAVGSAAVVHAHPLGSPETVDGQSRLSFHAEFETPGVYRLFVQVRVSDVVRTVPVTVRVA